MSEAMNKLVADTALDDINFLVSGDFNTEDTDPIFTDLTVSGNQLHSLRRTLPESDSDYGPTFNGYHPIATKFYNQLKEWCSPLASLVGQSVLIDHLFTRCPHYRAVHFEVLRRDEPIASDHYPIIGHFKQIRTW